MESDLLKRLEEIRDSKKKVTLYIIKNKVRNLIEYYGLDNINELEKYTKYIGIIKRDKPQPYQLYLTDKENKFLIPLIYDSKRTASERYAKKSNLAYSIPTVIDNRNFFKKLIYAPGKILKSIKYIFKKPDIFREPIECRLDITIEWPG